MTLMLKRTRDHARILSPTLSFNADYVLSAIADGSIMEPSLNTGDYLSWAEDSDLALPEKEYWIAGALAHEELKSLKESILVSLLVLLRRGLILGSRSTYCGDDC